MRTLHIGGFRIEVETPAGIEFSGQGYEEFLDGPADGPRSLPEGRMAIDVRSGECPDSWLRAWQPGGVMLDTASTWALARTGDASRPYHFGPSPTRPSDPPLFHARSDAEFESIELYLGRSFGDSRLVSGHLYPLDEIFMRHALAARRGLLVHAASVEIGGAGYLFLGDSGAGKSTISGFLADRFGLDAVMSDDRTILRKQDGSWFVYGSPWHGTLACARRGGVKLGGLCFIEKAPNHSYRKLGRAEALARLAQVYLGVWWLPELRMRQLETLESLVADGVPCVELSFARELGVVDRFVEYSKEWGYEARS